MSDPERAANSSVKYVAELAHVRELSLLGSADLDFWRNHLRPFELHPAEANGRAQLLISAMASRFRGVAFREFCVAVCVGRQARGAAQDGLFLAQAFNSSRTFAFIERTCFSTPYQFGKIEIDVRLPVSIQLVENGDIVFQAAMTGPDRPLLHRGDELWEGPIFLPRRRKLFFAKLAGQTCRYPFAAADGIEIEPSARASIFRQLSDSGFVGLEWIVRAEAFHAKGRTQRRSTAGAWP